MVDIKVKEQELRVKQAEKNTHDILCESPRIN